MPENRGPVIFASDIHLSGNDPVRTETFCAFLEREARSASAFFVLGDLFDMWVGSSQLRDPGLEPAFAALRTLASGPTRVVILHGNRDFLLGSREARDLGVEIPGESFRTAIHGREFLLTHGDEFCTHDRAYQCLRRILRSSALRAITRWTPECVNMAVGRNLRTRSKKASSKKAQRVMSFNLEDIERRARAEGIDVVVCGHVHRQDDRPLAGGGRLVVLPDWGARTGTYAVAREGEIHFETFQA